jgi:hypothetical protein
MEFTLFLATLGAMLGGVFFAIREEAESRETEVRIAPKPTDRRIESTSRFRLCRCARKSRFRGRQARV